MMRWRDGFPYWQPVFDHVYLSVGGCASEQISLTRGGVGMHPRSQVDLETRELVRGRWAGAGGGHLGLQSSHGVGPSDSVSPWCSGAHLNVSGKNNNRHK